MNWIAYPINKPENGSEVIALFKSKSVLKVFYFDNIGFTLEGTTRSQLLNITHFVYLEYPEE
jgi:hypothetical protein